jgi:hypothetical protein
VDGYRARWQGTEYEASPDGGLVRLYSSEPVSGFDEVVPGRYRRLVTSDEVERLTYVRTVARWQDQPVAIVAQRPGEFLVEYTGGHAAVALALGLTRADLGVYRGWANAAEITDLQQERLGG